MLKAKPTYLFTRHFLYNVYTYLSIFLNSTITSFCNIEINSLYIYATTFFLDYETSNNSSIHVTAPDGRIVYYACSVGCHVIYSILNCSRPLIFCINQIVNLTFTLTSCPQHGNNKGTNYYLQSVRTKVLSTSFVHQEIDLVFILIDNCSLRQLYFFWYFKL